MFKNCYTFHDKLSDYYTQAKSLEERLDEVLEVWLPDFAYDEAIEIPLHSKVKKLVPPIK